jgi:hypothetical protein
MLRTFDMHVPDPNDPVRPVPVPTPGPPPVPTPPPIDDPPAPGDPEVPIYTPPSATARRRAHPLPYNAARSSPRHLDRRAP